ncbi:S-adenosyl-L-methionine-dependent methyltransferase [Stachybotrys elegans]|uniref:S-adenosyl-L-methionine-dependent methyltransferase n=1 Tax=Stachybotrys elegans TaxID=80388 RepID=A0A8K0SYE2_9HYPO|nr:S-adenosyl-L-methionine-dependent methyltransferase [Stachybotrys elegans]
MAAILNEVQRSDKSQYGSAQRMYAGRAGDYDDSWHPDYSRRFVDFIDIKPGEKVLSLACGTGLDAILAVSRVGDQGFVVGVDATKEMLDKAREKQDANPVLQKHLKLLQHDVCDLDGCLEPEKGTFDLIICSNAFVLFERPDAVVAHWKDYLKPGGRMAIDITHEYNLHTGILLERVAHRLGVHCPFFRSWITDKDSFKRILEQQGMVVDQVEVLEKEGKGTAYLDRSEVDERFDFILNSPMLATMATQEFKVRGRPIFREEWEAASVDGKLEMTDQLYVYIARKP